MISRAAPSNTAEAICKGCQQAIVVHLAQINEKVTCSLCGFSSFLTPDRILRQPSVFQRKELQKKEEPKPKVNYPFTFVRHGQDVPQRGTIQELTTTGLKFITTIDLVNSSKVVFILKNKKFIATIKSCQLVSKNLLNQSIYEIKASFDTILQPNKF